MTQVRLQERQPLVNEFLALMGGTTTTAVKISTALNIQPRTGPLSADKIDQSIKNDFPEFYSSLPLLVNEHWRELYQGDLTRYDGDKSRGDFALAAFLASRGLNPDQMDQVMRTSQLCRTKWDSPRGQSTWLHQCVIRPVLTQHPSTMLNTQFGKELQGQENKFDLSTLRPQFIAGGMPARQFVGPKLGAQSLYPLRALSAVVALGAVGKTSLLMAHACHAAAGLEWNGEPMNRIKVIYFSVEETREELSRKFSAITVGWNVEDRALAMENLLLVPLLGQDLRLVNVERGNYRGSGTAERMIALANDFGLKNGLIILDHMQGFASGDLNASETATAICREANKIVEMTGCAVVFAAHISKANIKAESVEQGLAVGSLAFENSLRQLVGIIPMPEKEAQKLGITERQQYARLEIPKNSYGPSGGGVWLKKNHSPLYHTVVVEPVQLTKPMPKPIRASNERLLDLIIERVKSDPWITRNRIEGFAGMDGPFRASKTKVRDALKIGIESGLLGIRSLTPEERKENGLSRQVKEVLYVCM
jgi:hypothetical protein